MTIDHLAEMYESAYFGVQRVLDEAIGSEGDDGTGAGIVADVELLAYRYGLAISALNAAGATAAAEAIRQAELPALPVRAAGRPAHRTPGDNQ